jgi:hypothetical protein
MTAALLITVGLFIVFSGFALRTFVIAAVVSHSWSVNDYLRDKAHQRKRRSLSIIYTSRQIPSLE